MAGDEKQPVGTDGHTPLPDDRLDEVTIMIALLITAIVLLFLLTLYLIFSSV
jgi:hypothetical protein